MENSNSTFVDADILNVNAFLAEFQQKTVCDHVERVFSAAGLQDQIEPDLTDFLRDQANSLSCDSFSELMGELTPSMSPALVLDLWRVLCEQPLTVQSTEPPELIPVSTLDGLTSGSERAVVHTDNAGDERFVTGVDDTDGQIDTRDMIVPFLRVRASTAAAVVAPRGAETSAYQRAALTARAETRSRDLDTEAEDAAITRYTHEKRPSRPPATNAAAARAGLPIAARRAALSAQISASQVTIVEAPTGSGKSTQLPQYILDDCQLPGLVLCTQPRRVAALALAARVADERGEAVGETVGYKIRFSEACGPRTRLLYVTDGILLRLLVADPALPGVGALVVDEAHERSLVSDVVLGLVRRLVDSRARPDLRVVVASATLDTAKFANFFARQGIPAPVESVKGRTFPVELRYHSDSPPDFVRGAAECAASIHKEAAPGDILVFLPGADEISEAVRICRALCRAGQADQTDALAIRRAPPGPAASAPASAAGLEALVLPIYAALPSREQQRIFDPTPPGARKIIFATNIAETSLTVDGVVYVVDAGFSKMKNYDSRTGADTLATALISRQQADQRAGRAGRTRPGVCHRLYPVTTFESEMRAAPVPEIQRSNLASVVLALKALGVQDVARLPLLDPPAQATLRAALARLYLLGALSDSGSLTHRGAQLAKLPVSPEIGLLLIRGRELGIAAPATAVAAMLSVQSPFWRPEDHKRDADAAHAAFADAAGDHVCLYKIFATWRRLEPAARNSWCNRNFLHGRALKQANDVFAQLWRLSGELEGEPRLKPLDAAARAALCRAVVGGFALNAAVRTTGDGQAAMTTLLTSQPARIHPSSAIAGAAPACVVYSELFVSTAQYLRNVTRCRRSWLVDEAPRAFCGADGGVTAAEAAQTLTPLLRPWETKDSWRPSAIIKFQKEQGRRRH